MRGLLQLALDLFPAEGPLRRELPLEQADRLKGAEGAAYRHPQANRLARLEGVSVAYLFRRARRRSIGFSVDVQGLSVSAPRWVTLREVEQALLEKGPWIVRKLHESRQRAQQMESIRIDWREGAQLPYLGRCLTVRLDPAQRHAGGAVDETLVLGLPQAAGAEQIRDAAQAWLMRQAREYFQSRLEHFAPLLGVRWKRLSLSSASTRWGSAGADGSIRLHWRLIHLSPVLIDYVVVHELSHLRVMNHSPQFWATVGSVVPHYASLRRQLRDHPMADW
ncbi:MAG: M48 family metallopeptidase [Betaproteobacteria bacterium]|nr:M48 family metallopeptidase [Betaproteobacteria bacterium]